MVSSQPYTPDSYLEVNLTFFPYTPDSYLEVNLTFNVGFEEPPAPPSDSCTYTSGDWTIQCSDNCVINSDVDLGGNNILMNGTGTVLINNSALVNYSTLRIEGTDSSNICSVRFES